MICLELCAGCARLSKTLRARGFSTIVVDHSKNRPGVLHPTICVDLASEESVQKKISAF